MGINWVLSWEKLGQTLEELFDNLLIIFVQEVHNNESELTVEEMAIDNNSLPNSIIDFADTPTTSIDEENIHHKSAFAHKTFTNSSLMATCRGYKCSWVWNCMHCQVQILCIHCSIHHSQQFPILSSCHKLCSLFLRSNGPGMIGTIWLFVVCSECQKMRFFDFWYHLILFLDFSWQSKFSMET